jgi:hypothetical protein
VHRKTERFEEQMKERGGKKMFREILKKNARQIRFIGALVLCVLFIAASPTSPSDDSGCGSSSSDSSGTIVVQNYTNARVYVSVSGPTSTGFNLSNGYQKSISASTGSYTVSAVVDQSGSPYNGQTIYSRSFTVSANETETCAINW